MKSPTPPSSPSARRPRRRSRSASTPHAGLPPSVAHRPGPLPHLHRPWHRRSDVPKDDDRLPAQCGAEEAAAMALTKSSVACDATPPEHRPACARPSRRRTTAATSLQRGDIAMPSRLPAWKPGASPIPSSPLVLPVGPSSAKAAPPGKKLDRQTILRSFATN